MSTGMHKDTYERSRRQGTTTYVTSDGKEHVIPNLVWENPSNRKQKSKDKKKSKKKADILRFCRAKPEPQFATPDASYAYPAEMTYSRAHGLSSPRPSSATTYQQSISTASSATRRGSMPGRSSASINYANAGKYPAPRATVDSKRAQKNHLSHRNDEFINVGPGTRGYMRPGRPHEGSNLIWQPPRHHHQPKSEAERERDLGTLAFEFPRPAPQPPKPRAQQSKMYRMGNIVIGANMPAEPTKAEALRIRKHAAEAHEAYSAMVGHEPHSEFQGGVPVRRKERGVKRSSEGIARRDGATSGRGRRPGLLRRLFG